MNGLDPYFQQAEESSGKAGLVSDQLVCRTNVGAVTITYADYAAATTRVHAGLNWLACWMRRPLITQSLNNLSNVALLNGKTDLRRKV